VEVNFSDIRKSLNEAAASMPFFGEEAFGIISGRSSVSIMVSDWTLNGPVFYWRESLDNGIYGSVANAAP
jgi:hypothetical protein